MGLKLMSTNAVSAITSQTPSTSDTQAVSTSKNTLSQNDFLQLLVTQMTTQDPLNPQSSTDFSAQMAQFTSLEQAKNMASDIAKLQSNEQFTSANNMLGRTVSLDDNTAGVVSGVNRESGTPKILVNGLYYDLSQVQSVYYSDSRLTNNL